MSCSEEKKRVTDLDRLNLKGKVRQIDEIYYPTYQDLQRKENGEKRFIRFNEQGLITKHATFMRAGQIHWMKYHYNSDSVWIDEIREAGDKSEHPQKYWLYKINEQGAQYAITCILIDSSINFHTDLELDADNRITEISYSQKREPERYPCSVTKTYDEAGRLKEELTYQYDKITKKCSDSPFRSVFTVNEQGDIEREVVYDPSGKKMVVNSFQFNYNKEGNWFQKVHIVGDRATDVTVRKFTYYPPDSTEED